MFVRVSPPTLLVIARSTAAHVQRSNFPLNVVELESRAGAVLPKPLPLDILLRFGLECGI
jgi:hypothetical protein